MFARRLASRMTSRAMPQRRAMSGHPPPEYEGLEKALRAVFPENWQVRTPIPLYTRACTPSSLFPPANFPHPPPTAPRERAATVSAASCTGPCCCAASSSPLSEVRRTLSSNHRSVPLLSCPSSSSARPPAAAHRPTFTYCHHPHSSVLPSARILSPRIPISVSTHASPRS